jgi:hypothetical protein
MYVMLELSRTEANKKQDYISGSSTMFNPRALHSSGLTREMIYPLNIDLSSLDFQQRLEHLLSRYMRVCRFSPSPGCSMDFSLLSSYAQFYLS